MGQMTRSAVRFAIGLWPLLLAACAEPPPAIAPTDLSAVKPGASRAEIEAVLGEPSQSSIYRGIRIASYGYNRGNTDDPPSAEGGLGYSLLLLTPIPAVVEDAAQRGELQVIYGPDDIARQVYRDAGWLGLCKAANDGKPQAQLRVGFHYMNGIWPSPANKVQAYRWIGSAASGAPAEPGNDTGRRAQALLEELVGKMNPLEVAEAERMIREESRLDCWAVLITAAAAPRE